MILSHSKTFKIVSLLHNNFYCELKSRTTPACLSIFLIYTMLQLWFKIPNYLAYSEFLTT